MLQRARLVAYAKAVPFEEINVHLKVKPDWYVEKINPYGKVPVVEHEGHIIRESLINFGKHVLSSSTCIRANQLPLAAHKLLTQI